jgi:hypothetical protein
MLHPGKAPMSHRETITVPCPGGSRPEASGASFVQSRQRVCSGRRCGLPRASFVLMPATLRTLRHRSMVHFYDRFPDQFCGQSKIAIYGAGTLTHSRAWRPEHATWHSGFAGQTV